MQLSFDVRDIPVVVDDTVFDDFRTLRLANDLVSNGNIMAAADLGERLFGEEQLSNIVEQLEVDGLCRVSDIVPFMLETISAASEAKAAGDLKN